MDEYQIQKIIIQQPYNVQQEGKIKQVLSYRQSSLLTFVFYLLCLTSGGLFYFLSRWKISIWIKVRLLRCKVEYADYILIIGLDNTQTLVVAQQQQLNPQKQQKIFHIMKYRFQKYYFEESQQMFLPIELDLSKTQNNQIINQYCQGILTQQQLIETTQLYGLNQTRLPNKEMCEVFQEVLSPFYIFSLFSVCLWFIDGYTLYAAIIVVLSIISICETLYQQIIKFRKLQAIAKNESKVKVYRFCDNLTLFEKGQIKINPDNFSTNNYIEINSNFLVSGDIVKIEDNQIMTCDLILFTGQTVMNESMLTGESVPVIKNMLPYNSILYNSVKSGKQSTLFSGSLCIETKIVGKGIIPVLAVVTQTGFNTLKGYQIKQISKRQLIKSIMFTSSKQLKFYQDILKFIYALGIFAVVGFFITLQSKLQQLQQQTSNPGYIISRILELITIAIPPVLPASLQMGTTIALFRLKLKKIFCISPFKVNTAGKITMMCFDKTGTLTEDCLDMLGILIIGINTQKDILGFQISKMDSSKSPDINQTGNFTDEVIVSEYQNGEYTQEYLSASLLMTQTMATCHCLSLLNGVLIGDPLDQKVFEQTKQIIQDEEQIGFQCLLFIQ